MPLLAVCKRTYTQFHHMVKGSELLDVRKRPRVISRRATDKAHVKST